MVKIRLQGTREELADVIRNISAILKIKSISKPFPSCVEITQNISVFT